MIGFWDMLARSTTLFALGFVLQAELVRLAGPRWFLAFGALTALAGLAARQRNARRTWVWLWTASTQLATATYAVAYVAAAVLAVTR